MSWLVFVILNFFYSGELLGSVIQQHILRRVYAGWVPFRIWLQIRIQSRVRFFFLNQTVNFKQSKVLNERAPVSDSSITSYCSWKVMLQPPEIFFLLCFVLGSVADPGCYRSRISDSGSKNNNKKETEKFCCLPFSCSHKFHKNKIFHIVTKLPEIGVGDPESGKNYPRSRIQVSKRYRIRDPEQGVKISGSRIRIRNTKLQAVCIAFRVS